MLLYITELVCSERLRQLKKWGPQHHPNGTGNAEQMQTAAYAKMDYERASKEGRLTWCHILNEEVAEAFAESDTERLKEELVQVMAVCAAWIEDLDSF